MKINDVIAEKYRSNLKDAKVVGLDIGSRTSKGVLFANGKIYTALLPTGLYNQETADELLDKLLKEAKLRRADISYIVSTGYGRISLKFKDIPNKVVTEISCHAIGAHFLNPKAKTIIDIGGQDSKAIKIDPNSGKVIEFVMNDKCAAGTGRFLEKAANLLDLTLDELGEVALKSKNPSVISSQCVVFAESEVISLRAKGENLNDRDIREDIAAGIHYSAARRVHNLLNRIGIEPELVFTGGVSNNPGMRRALEELQGHRFSEVGIDTIYAGALGAAIYASKYLPSSLVSSKKASTSIADEINDFKNRILKQQEALINSNGGTKKVGYLCVYTPLELLNASGVNHARLFKAGSAGTVAQGELITANAFCDHTKSCLGAFKEGDSFCKSLDKVYTFYTCAQMKRVAEAINHYYSPAETFNLPKLRDREESRNFFKNEIVRFKEDLEKLQGEKIPESKLQEQIVLYNQIRRLLKKISALRKRPNPPLTGKEFLELAKGYYYLPPEELLNYYKKIYKQLSAVPVNGDRRLRLMISGSIMADGDRRLLELVEDEIGARVVVEDHCTGLKPFYHTITQNGDPIKALANGYLDQAPCARMKPLDDGVEFSGKLAKEYNVDGILYVYLKFCPSYGVGKKDFIQHFQKLGLPVLEISNDYSQSDQGQLKTRVEAFVEVLNEKGGN